MVCHSQLLSSRAYLAYTSSRSLIEASSSNHVRINITVHSATTPALSTFSTKALDLSLHSLHYDECRC
ncbi:hypothetical protein VTL71DRAFT_11031, partial [Oculimacula yallundae]